MNRIGMNAYLFILFSEVLILVVNGQHTCLLYQTQD